MPNRSMEGTPIRVAATSRLSTPMTSQSNMKQNIRSHANDNRSAATPSPRRLGPLTLTTSTMSSSLEAHIHPPSEDGYQIPLKPTMPSLPQQQQQQQQPHSVAASQVLALIRQKARQQEALAQKQAQQLAAQHAASAADGIFLSSVIDYRDAKATSASAPAILAALRIPTLQERRSHSHQAQKTPDDWNARFLAEMYPVVQANGRDELVALATLLDGLVGELMQGTDVEQDEGRLTATSEDNRDPAPEGSITLDGRRRSTGYQNLSVVVDRAVGIKHQEAVAKGQHAPLFDATSFLLQQQGLSTVLSAACKEIARQTVSECGERAVVLENLRKMFGSLLDNAHRAVNYFSRLYEELAGLKLHETVQTLSVSLTEAQEEITLLRHQLVERDQQIISHSRVTQELQRLQQWKANAEKVLQAQVQRNGAILKMTSDGTGGVITSNNTGFPGGGGANSMAMSTNGGLLLNASPSPSKSSVSGLRGRMRSLVSVVKEVMEERRGSIQEAVSSKTSAMEQSFAQSESIILQPNDKGFLHSEESMSDGSDSSMEVEMVDAITQTTLEDTTDLQLMGESQTYFEEMDRAAGYTQSLCRFVYGTTDFYTPSEACQNALSILEEITQRAFAMKDIAKEKAAASLPAGVRQRAGGEGPTSSTLLGYYDLPKTRIIKLLQYGTTAAKEMRLRFQTMVDNEAFKRALDWRAPRNAQEPCKMCQRVGHEEEGEGGGAAKPQATMEKSLALVQERLKVATDERDHVSQLLERSQKRLEFERALSQGRADELEAIARIKRLMVSASAQTDTQLAIPTTPTPPASRRRSLLGVDRVGSAQPTTPQPDNSLLGVDLTNTDVPFPSSSTNEGMLDVSGPSGGNSPFPTEWAAGGANLRSAPPSRERRGSINRRRSSIEVTFDDDQVLDRSPAPPPPLAVPRIVPMQPVRSRSTSVTDSEASTSRRQIDVAVSNASRFKNAFISLTAFRRSPPTSRTNSMKSSPVDGALVVSQSQTLLPMIDEKLLASVQPKTLGWGLKFITCVYRCRYVPPNSSATASPSGSRSTSPSTDTGSCSRHFYDYLRQKFGTKQLIDENALAFLRTLHLFAPTDARFGLFARQFSDEFPAFVYRHFLTFVTCLDTTLLQFDNSSYAKKGGDDTSEMATVPLEAILNGIHHVFVVKDRYSDNQDLCRELTQFAINISIVRSSNAGPASSRRVSTVQSKTISTPGTEIDSSDSFSKYRAFRVQIPQDAIYREVIRVSFLTKLCETMKVRMYGVSTPVRQSRESTPISNSPSIGM